MTNKKHAKKQKVHLIFDPAARRQFLGGFHKRKLERKAKAQEELQRKLKEERQKIKQDAKESYKKMVQSHKGVPEVEHLLQEEHETDSATVRIVELSTNTLAKENNWIGTNLVQYENQEEENDTSNGESDHEEVPGMSLEVKELKVNKKKTDTSDEKREKVFRSAKDIKKILRKESTKAVKKSKAFQLKHKMERIKSLKKSKQQRKVRAKAHQKRDKKKHGKRRFD